MKVKIEKFKAAGSWLENRIIHMSEADRTAAGIELYDLVNIKDAFGNQIALQVVDGNTQGCVFVSPCVYERIETDSNTNTVEHINNVTLGCDPEFFIVEISSGRVVRPNVFMKSGQGQLGYDGVLMEIRPDPSENELELCCNIEKLIIQAKHMLDVSGFGHDLMLWAASSYDGYTAGFHLHFGIPKQILRPNQDARRIASLATYIMDYYIGTICVLSEGCKDYIRRTSPMIKYGKPGGFNLDTKTFEYRFPGGNFLKHPMLTLGLITLGKVVVEDIISRINECTDNFSNTQYFSTVQDVADLYPNIPDTKALLEILCNCNTSLASSFFGRIIEDIRCMIGYYNKSLTLEDFFCNIGNDYSSIIDKNWNLVGGTLNGRQEKEVGFCNI